MFGSHNGSLTPSMHHQDTNRPKKLENPVLSNTTSGHEGNQTVLCSTLLIMKFKQLLLINIENAKINRIIRFNSQTPVIYPANKC